MINRFQPAETCYLVCKDGRFLLLPNSVNGSPRWEPKPEDGQIFSREGAVITATAHEGTAVMFRRDGRIVNVRTSQPVTTTQPATTSYVVVDRRDGFNLCSRETMRSPFTTQSEAETLADHLNGAHPAKPYVVTQSASREPYITRKDR